MACTSYASHAIVIACHRHRMSSSSHVIVITFRCHRISSSSHVIVIACHRHRMSSSSHVIVIACRCHRMSSSSHVDVIACRRHRMSSSSHVDVIACRCHRMSSSSRQRTQIKGVPWQLDFIINLPPERGHSSVTQRFFPPPLNQCGRIPCKKKYREMTITAYMFTPTRTWRLYRKADNNISQFSNDNLL